MLLLLVVVLLAVAARPIPVPFVVRRSCYDRQRKTVVREGRGMFTVGDCALVVGPAACVFVEGRRERKTRDGVVLWSVLVCLPASLDACKTYAWRYCLVGLALPQS